MTELKKAKQIRFLFRVLFFIVGFMTPITIMLCKFNFKTATTVSRFTFIGALIVILIIALLWKFKSRLYEWINNWEYSILKYILIGFSRVYIFILILIIMLITKADIIAGMQATTDKIINGINNAEFCILTICVCQTIAYLIFYPLEEKYDYRVKRLIRKQERKEDLNETLNERGN